MEKKMNSRPNSGVGAILDLLSFDIKEIYITGFTLFQTNYSTDYRKNVDNIQGNTCKLALARMKKSGHHNQEKTALVFKNNILTDKRVKYDKILDQLKTLNDFNKKCIELLRKEQLFNDSKLTMDFLDVIFKDESLPLFESMMNNKRKPIMDVLRIIGKELNNNHS